MDLGELDFGDCEMAMGIAYVDGDCIIVGGCGWEVDGFDYSPYSFESFDQCQSACVDSLCIDPSIIDPNVICPSVIDPVCGCDSVTYNNSCEASNWYGIQSWSPGECDTPNVIWQVEERSLNVSPNPFIDQFILNLDKRKEGTLTVLDLAGRELVKMSVYPGINVVNIGATPSGLYMVCLMYENGLVLTSKVVKQ